jgi:hypothetical protein
MSQRPPAWWKAPLAQWRAELRPALNDYWSRSGGAEFGPADIKTIGDTLDRLVQHSTVERMLHQLLRERGPQVMMQVMMQRDRMLWPTLTRLVFDAELRPHGDIVRFSEEQKAVLDDLLPANRLRICAAGYLLLIAALVARDIAGDLHEESEEFVASPLAVEHEAQRLLSATRWLYGREQPRPVGTLVRVLTKRKFNPSSLQWRAKRPPS